MLTFYVTYVWFLFLTSLLKNVVVTSEGWEAVPRGRGSHAQTNATGTHTETQDWNSWVSKGRDSMSSHALSQMKKTLQQQHKYRKLYIAPVKMNKGEFFWGPWSCIVGWLNDSSLTQSKCKDQLDQFTDALKNYLLNPRHSSPPATGNPRRSGYKTTPSKG